MCTPPKQVKSWKSRLDFRKRKHGDWWFTITFTQFNVKNHINNSVSWVCPVHLFIPFLPGSRLWIILGRTLAWLFVTTCLSLKMFPILTDSNTQMSRKSASHFWQRPNLIRPQVWMLLLFILHQRNCCWRGEWSMFFLKAKSIIPIYDPICWAGFKILKCSFGGPTYTWMMIWTLHSNSHLFLVEVFFFPFSCRIEHSNAFQVHRDTHFPSAKQHWRSFTW